MIVLRRAEDRGHLNHGWLDTYHTFSFGDYEDPQQMGFRSLRVINEDCVQPGQGFGTHPHWDMEILTYVLEGTLAHKDNMGNGSTLRPGEVQRMSAGTGVTHSEYNSSTTEPVHLLQIWILPDRKGMKPSYEQKAYPEKERRGKVKLVASPNGRENSVMIHQDAHVYASLLSLGQEIDYPLRAGRHAWVQVARGETLLNGGLLKQGDGAAISDEERLKITAKGEVEFLLFDLA